MKKITIKNIQKIIDSETEREFKTDFYGNELIIRHSINLQEMIAFVNSTVDACFSDSDNKYIPEVMGFAFKSNIIDYYTNLSMPKDFNDRYTYIYDLWGIAGELICGKISEEQIIEIKKSVQEKIRDRIYFINRINNVANDILIKISDYTEKMFNGIDKEDISIIANAIKNNDWKIDESKIIDAILSHKE